MKRLLILLFLIIGSVTINAQNAQQLKQLDEAYTSPQFRSLNSITLVPMNDDLAISSFNVFQYLQGKIAGLQVYNSFGFHPTIRYRSGYPALFLDEMRVDAQMLSSISMNDVAIIKIFRPPFLGSFGGANGAIAVYTKNGDED